MTGNAHTESDAHSIVAEVLLGRLEKIEQKVLEWGLTEGSFSLEELVSIVEPLIDELDPDCLIPNASAVIDNCIQMGLLFPLPDREERYRTRSAESVRLFASLRQLFPKHMKDGGWQGAPRLVGDYRYLRRERQFPSRNLLCSEVINQVAVAIETPPNLGAVKCLADLFRNSDGSEWSFSGFQARTFSELLRNANKSQTTGSIICAGTGSGKTIAYYAPVLAWIANHIATIKENAVRSISVYPRNELLKDQFVEVYSLTVRLNKGLSGRKIAVGAYFGPTPASSKALEDPSRAKQLGWIRTPDGFLCPYFRCFNSNCESQMVWRDSDRTAVPSKHILHCPTCGAVTEEGLVLTRKRLRSEPPDILLTSTEMLNQHLADNSVNHLFGVGNRVPVKPKFFLLDEVHTYSGPSGAQVGFLLRRWKHLVKGNVAFAGLSATLANAEEFFSELIGVQLFRIQKVTPKVNEMKSRGAEYLLLLRGNPASKRSTLSVSIQASMLLGRVLDPTANSLSKGLYGAKAFIFTDDLDVTNRLYWDFLSAEGRKSSGDVDTRVKGSLSHLRSPDHFGDPRGARFADGQRWDLCSQLGYQLDDQDRLRIGRTTSQDIGVVGDAKAIVATASLEVGYNDPTVGGVLQHKAPRDLAQFLQRRGRAGRSQSMRPWTVVVLSDYGRDRVTYQSYERLFDPELPPKNLPIKNIAVLRMQAVFAIMDWVNQGLVGVGSGSVYRDFSEPWQGKVSEGGRWASYTKQRQEAEIELLESVLQFGDRYDTMQTFVSKALGGVELDVLHEIFWEPPRGLITEVIPTILRRLKFGWMALGEVNAENVSRKSPLPEFIPRTLFSDLNLPEIFLEFQDGTETEEMPVASGMKEYSPGRVSRRYGVRHAGIRHWIPIDLEASESTLVHEIETICSGTNHQWTGVVSDDGKLSELSVLRPSGLFIESVPRAVKDSSNSVLTWHTNIMAPEGKMSELAFAQKSGVGSMIRTICPYLHRLSNPVQISRFATGYEANINFDTGETKRFDGRFVRTERGQEQPCALGFTLEVDALKVEVTLPDYEAMLESCGSPELLRSLRARRFHSLLHGSTDLCGLTSYFERQWLADVFIGLVCVRSIEENIALSDAAQLFLEYEDAKPVLAVLDVLFMNSGAVEAGDTTGEVDRDLLQDRLLELFNNSEIRSMLENASHVLSDDVDDDWTEWIGEKWLSTLGGAFVNAIQAFCPNLDASDLLFDLNIDNLSVLDVNDSGSASFWITEKNLGGGGILESFVKEYSNQPGAFFRLFESTLSPNENEELDRQFSNILGQLVSVSSNPVKECFAAARMAEAYEDKAVALEKVRSVLRDVGILPTPPLMATINSRVLRSQSNRNTDELLYELSLYWDKVENSLGVEMDARIIAFLASRKSSVREHLRQNLAGDEPGNFEYWAFTTLFGLLWARGVSIREDWLSVYNPYSSAESPDRLLASGYLKRAENKIDVSVPGWSAEYERLMESDGEVVLYSSSGLDSLKQSLVQCLLLPIDTGGLMAYGSIQKASLLGGNIEVLLALDEFK